MAHDAIPNSTLVRTLSDLLRDLSDLVRKEIRLARAELTEKVNSGVQATLWLAIAAVFGLIAVLLVVEAIVFALASLGLALYWACLVVAGVLALCGVAAFAYGRSGARKHLIPARSIRQMTEDIRTAKEHLS